MAGFSATIDYAALPRALGPRCGLRLEPTYGHLVLPAMEELYIASDIHRCSVEDQPTRVFNGLHLLGRALRGFAGLGHRCRQYTVSNRLSVHASRLLAFDQLNTSNIRADEHGVWEVHLGGVDVGSALRRATKAMLRDQRYKQAGLSLALALVYAAGGDDEGGDEPLGARDVWGGFATIDPYGRIRTTDELEAHFRQLRHRRIDALVQKELRFAQALRPPLLGTDPETGMRVPIAPEDECCCCWALPTDAQELATNSRTVF